MSQCKVLSKALGFSIKCPACGDGIEIYECWVTTELEECCSGCGADQSSGCS